jgi:methionine aminopeptidase
MDVPISGKSTKLINDVVDITFTVPTDGRAVDTSVKVEIGTDKGFEYGYASINLQEPTPKYMEQIATLFTIQVVLLIVCTIIIAATIFLSARRPSLVWKAEEKAE